MKIASIGALKGGAVIFAQADLKQRFDLPGGDTVAAKLTLATSHDGSMKLSGMCGTVRFVCMNTLRAGMAEAKRNKTEIFRISHTRSWASKMQQAKELVERSQEQFAQFREVAEELASVKYAQEELRHFAARVNGETPEYKAAFREERPSSALEAVIGRTEAQQVTDEMLGRFGRKLLAAVVNSPGSRLPSADGTWWGAVNGVTYLADHRGEGKGAEARDKAVTSALFGAKAKQKERAVEIALEYARRA